MKTKPVKKLATKRKARAKIFAQLKESATYSWAPSPLETVKILGRGKQKSIRVPPNTRHGAIMQAWGLGVYDKKARGFRLRKIVDYWARDEKRKSEVLRRVTILIAGPR